MKNQVQRYNHAYDNLESSNMVKLRKLQWAGHVQQVENRVGGNILLKRRVGSEKPIRKPRKE